MKVWLMIRGCIKGMEAGLALFTMMALVLCLVKRIDIYVFVKLWAVGGLGCGIVGGIIGFVYGLEGGGMKPDVAEIADEVMSRLQDAKATKKNTP